MPFGRDVGFVLVGVTEFGDELGEVFVWVVHGAIQLGWGGKSLNWISLGSPSHWGLVGLFMAREVVA
jgi:hypothetical protein